MLAKSTDQKFIFVTSLLVFLMGAQTLHSLATDDLSSLSSSQVQLSSRQPASVKPVFQDSAGVDKLANQVHQELAIDFNCQKNLTKNVSVHTRLVQFRGQGCLKSFDHGRLTIINQSNGYTASIFQINGGQYETDMIQLNEGENKIMIQYLEPSGHKIEQELSVVSTHI